MFEQPVFLTRKPTAEDKALEEDDPYELLGVRYPVDPGVDAERVNALAIVEEYALMGWSPRAIVGLFADPHAGHIHDIYRRRGDVLIHDLLSTVFGPTHNEV